MNKPLRITLTVLVSLLVLCGLVLLGFRAFFRLGAFDYYRHSEKAFEIPNLNTGFVPQGLCYDYHGDFFLAGGYDAKGGCSSLVVIAADGKTVKTLYIEKDGKDYTGHLGGCAVNGGYVYITGDKNASLYVLSYTDIENAKDGDRVSVIGAFGTDADSNHIGAAFVTKVLDSLIIGEFYKTPEYETAASHKLTTKHGDYQQALAFVFRLDDDEPFGIAKEIEQVISLPDLAQGLAYDNGKYYVSTSWGLAFSHILVYDSASVEKQEDIELFGNKYPLIALDGAALVDTMKIAPMSEEMAIVDNKLYVMCESASNKYIFGKLLGAKYCYATDLQ